MKDEKIILSLVPAKDGSMPALIVNVCASFTARTEDMETYKIFFADNGVFYVLELTETGEWVSKSSNDEVFYLYDLIESGELKTKHVSNLCTYESINNIALSESIITISNNSHIDANLLLTSQLWEKFINKTKSKLISKLFSMIPVEDHTLKTEKDVDPSVDSF